MFKVGDMIYYANSGVCKVKAVGTPDISGVNEKRIYYTLQPYYLKDSTIFTPVDNKKVMMRPILTRDEALSLIDEIKDIGTIDVENEKGLEAEYKEAMGRCDCRELVRVIKTIYLRKKKRQAEEKKTTAVDERYFKAAEENLYGELALSLELSPEETRDYVLDRVDKLAVQ